MNTTGHQNYSVQDQSRRKHVKKLLEEIGLLYDRILLENRDPRCVDNVPRDLHKLIEEYSQIDPVA